MPVVLLIILSSVMTPDRVGRVTIEGNTDTPDSIILRHIELYTGQVLDYSAVEATRKKLGMLGLFDSEDPPSVEVVQNEFGEKYKIIRIRVTERPGNWVVFAMAETIVGLATLDAELLIGVTDRIWEKLQ